MEFTRRQNYSVLFSFIFIALDKISLALLPVKNKTIVAFLITWVCISNVLLYCFVTRGTELPKDEAPNSQQDCFNISKEAQYAIQRAKTGLCKEKLRNLACLLERKLLFPSVLYGTCPQDDVTVYRQNVGCFADSKDARILNASKQTLPETNKPEVCVRWCHELGHAYAGVQYGIECFCGDELPSDSVFIPQYRCNALSCPGNHSQSCGGIWAMEVFRTGLHLKTKPVLTYAEPTLSAVRIVFMLTFNGRSIRQIRRMLNLIYSPKHYYYIHVDSRQQYLYNELLPLEQQADNIRLKRRRFATIWGGSSLLTMLLDAVKDLFVLLPQWNWDFFVNLSEADMPVLTVEELSNLLSVNRDKNFVKSHGRSSERFVKKQGLRWTFYECENHLWRIGTRELPEGIRIDGGSDWVILNRSFLQYVVLNPDTFASGLLEYYRYALLPAESFFHTMLINSRFCSSIVDANLKLTNWKRSVGCKCQYRHVVDWCGCSPNVFRMSDAAKFQRSVLKSRLIYTARKFDATIDQNIIAVVEAGLNQAYLQNWNTWFGDSDTTCSKERFAKDLAVRSTHSGLHSYWHNDYHFLYDSTAKVPFLQALAEIAVNYTVMLAASRGLSCRCYFDAPVARELTLHFSQNGPADLLLLTAVGCGFSDVIFETRFSILKRYTIYSSRNSRLKTFEVGTDFDPKELVFRNYFGVVRQNDAPVVRLQFLSGPSWPITVLWINPVADVLHVAEEEIGEEAVVISSAFSQPFLTHSGVWKVKVLLGNELVASTEFLVLPEATAAHRSLVPFTADILRFYEPRSTCSVSVHSPSAVSICESCLFHSLPECTQTTWSSKAADPKSEFRSRGICV